MNIFFKYIARSMLEKKARLILLLISISLSTGLFVASTGAVQVAINGFVKPILATFEGKDISINAKPAVPFFSLDGIKKDGIKDLRGELILPGIINEKETKHVTLHGRGLKDLDSSTLVKGSLQEFAGKTAIISKRMSEERKLDMGDRISFFLGGEEQVYTVIGISKNDGVFYNDKKTDFGMIVPYDTLAKQLKVEGKYNSVFANKELSTAKESVKAFNRANAGFVASELFDQKLVDQAAQKVTAVLYVMLAVVVFMSAIIIYGSFKLTITERMSIIGTFLSQGATKGVIKRILYLESLTYGLIGAVFGNALGITGLYIINYFVSPLRKYGMIEKFSFNPSYLFMGVVFALLLALTSAWIPIQSIRKLQVKDIILNNINLTMEIGWVKFLIGITLIGLSLWVGISDGKWTSYAAGPFIIVSIIGVVLIYPKLIDLMTRRLFYWLKGRSKTLVFAINNLRTSKVLLGNITLIMISMLSIIMITSIGSSMQKVVVEAYTKMHFGISVAGFQGGQTGALKSTTEQIKEILQKDKDIEPESIGLQYQTFGTIKGKPMIIEGIDPKTYPAMNKYLTFDKEMFDSFLRSNDREVILSENALKTINAKVGDSVPLKLYETSVPFTITGSFDGKLYMNGQAVFIKNESLTKAFPMIQEATGIFANTTISPAKVKDELLPKLKRYGASITTHDEFKKQNVESNQMIVNVLSIFSYMAIFIASLGVFNNISIGFLQRKRELAVFSSVGMSNKNRAWMLILESFMCVVYAVLFSWAYSYLGLALVTKLLKLAGMSLEVTLNVGAIPVYFIASLTLILFASIPVLMKSRRLSIIEELKYE